MTVREILRMGDPRLLRVARPVPAFDTPDLHALIADMFDTMRAAEGAGLAAPQIGVDLAIDRRTQRVEPAVADAGVARHHAAQAGHRQAALPAVFLFIGQRLDAGIEQHGFGHRLAVRVAAVGREAEHHDRQVEGFHARVVQHECDHLIGKLYPMRMRDFTRFGYTAVLFPDLDLSDED